MGGCVAKLPGYCRSAENPLAGRGRSSRFRPSDTVIEVFFAKVVSCLSGETFVIDREVLVADLATGARKLYDNWRSAVKSHQADKSQSIEGELQSKYGIFLIFPDIDQSGAMSWGTIESSTTSPVNSDQIYSTLSEDGTSESKKKLSEINETSNGNSNTNIKKEIRETLRSMDSGSSATIKSAKIELNRILIRRELVRLRGVDAPVEGQRYFTEAKEELRRQIIGQMIECHAYELRLHNNYISFALPVDVIKLVTDEWISLTMATSGFVWHNTEVDDRMQLGMAVIHSRQNQHGLWKDAYPMSPWEFDRARRKKDSFREKVGLSVSPVASRRIGGTPLATPHIHASPSPSPTNPVSKELPSPPSSNRRSSHNRVIISSDSPTGTPPPYLRSVGKDNSFVKI